MNRRILTSAITVALLLLAFYFTYIFLSANYYPPAEKRVIILGFDGMDARLTEKWMDEGRLPNLALLRSTGTYSRIKTTTPADTPVAWTTVATGLNPGRHNVLDFLDRDPETYMPRIALVKKEEVEGQKPKVYNLKDGVPIWKTVGEEGGWSTVINFPVTFPSEEFRGKMLSGIGTPDLRGTWGTFTLYKEHINPEETEMGGNLLPVSFTNNEAQAYLYGPRNMKIDMIIKRSGDYVTLFFGGKEYRVREAEWSDWADIQFEVNPLVKVKGVGRFYLIKANPLSLYLMPVSMDPRDPFFRISTPEGYSNEIAKHQGLYKTVGWADDTWALNDEAISEAVFLQDAYRTLEFKEKLLFDEMEKKPTLLIAIFYQTDTIQHTFYRYMDEENPNYQNIPGDERTRYKDEILRIYQRMDDVVGKVMERADDDTTVIVLSDHGFNPFRKAVNLNRWLADNGFLKLRPGANSTFYRLNNLFGEKGLFWNDVLMNESEAYSLGLGNIYINLKGRESQGIVEPKDYDAVRDKIIKGLVNLRDPQSSERIIAKVQKREALYSGPYTNNSADLVVSFNPGYRVSWQTTLGGVPPEVVEPNMRKWAGDHSTLDPDQTEGVFFINREIRLERKPSLLDVNPTVRDILELSKDDTLDGRSVLKNRKGIEVNNEIKIPDAKGYNVLFVTLDDVRVDYISAYNENSLANTTNIDGLASRGFLFDNAFTGFTLTCPSHTIIMTGRYFGDTATPRNKYANLPQTLNASGYATGASVGFAGLKSNACSIGSMFSEYDTGSLSAKPGKRGALSANYTIDWIKKNRDKKFFFWLHLYDAHPPGIGASKNQSENYARSIEYVDRQIGRVIEVLNSEGIENRTIVVLAADHGQGGEFSNVAENRKLYDTATHVPLIIYIPDAKPAGKKVSTLASLADLAPTLSELLAIPYDETHGVSLVDGLRDPNYDARTEVFASFDFRGRSQDMVRTLEWKLIKTRDSKNKNSTIELFHLSADSFEKNNVSALEPRVLEKLNALLEFYSDLRKTGATGRISQPRQTVTPSPLQSAIPSIWYGYGNDTQPLDNQTLNDLRAFGYIN